VTRNDGRAPGDHRPIRFERGFTEHAPGSVLASFGRTRVLCTAMAVDGVPHFLKGKGKGWLTAEYNMLPCDVLQADGGTRTTAISGAYVALCDLFKSLDDKRLLREWPLTTQLGAVSVGVVGGEVLCDLDYSEDSTADVDMNVVMTGAGEFVEVQGSAEGAPFPRADLDRLLESAEAGIRSIFEHQQRALEGQAG
jgi:ribonuclease PH